MSLTEKQAKIAAKVAELLIERVDAGSYSITQALHDEYGDEAADALSAVVAALENFLPSASALVRPADAAVKFPPEYTWSMTDPDVGIIRSQDAYANLFEAVSSVCGYIGCDVSEITWYTDEGERILPDSDDAATQGYEGELDAEFQHACGEMMRIKIHRFAPAYCTMTNDPNAL